MRNLSVIAVRLIKGVRLPDTDVDGQGYPLVDLALIEWTTVNACEVSQEWIRAGGIPGWVGETQNVLVFTHGESRRAAKFRILQLLTQLFVEMAAPGIVRLEG